MGHDERPADQPGRQDQPISVKAKSELNPQGAVTSPHSGLGGVPFRPRGSPSRFPPPSCPQRHRNQGIRVADISQGDVGPAVSPAPTPVRAGHLGPAWTKKQRPGQGCQASTPSGGFQKRGWGLEEPKTIYFALAEKPIRRRKVQCPKTGRTGAADGRVPKSPCPHQHRDSMNSADQRQRGECCGAD